MIQLFQNLKSSDTEIGDGKPLLFKLVHCKYTIHSLHIAAEDPPWFAFLGLSCTYLIPRPPNKTKQI